MSIQSSGSENTPQIFGNVQGMKKGQVTISTSNPTDTKVQITAKRIRLSGTKQKRSFFRNPFRSKRVTFKVIDQTSGSIFEVSVRVKDLSRNLGLTKAEIKGADKKGLEQSISNKLRASETQKKSNSKPRKFPESPPPPLPAHIKQKPQTTIGEWDNLIQDLMNLGGDKDTAPSTSYENHIVTGTTTQIAAASKDASTFKTPAASDNLSDFGLTQKEYNTLCDFYKDNINDLKTLTEPTHLKKDFPPPLPRSLIYVPNGPRKGMYILCKTKGGVGEVGVGSFNLATKMLHIDTGQEKVFRNGRYADVPESEISANEKFREVDPHGEHFATGVVVKYKGSWRQRRGRVKNQDKTQFTKHENVKKVGLIMDLIPGGELFETIAAPPTQRDQTSKQNIEICLNIAKGLAKSHAAGLVNLDNKPENIFMDGDNPKIGDFGMIYKTGTVISSPRGSPGYLSPEVLNSKDVPFKIQPKNEMWIMGCMLAAITKGWEFDDWNGQMSNDIFKLLNNGSDGLQDAVQTFFPDHAKEGSLDYAIAKCLSWNPEDRLSAADLVPILQKLHNSM